MNKNICKIDKNTTYKDKVYPTRKYTNTTSKKSHKSPQEKNKTEQQYFFILSKKNTKDKVQP